MLTKDELKTGSVILAAIALMFAAMVIICWFNGIVASSQITYGLVCAGLVLVCAILGR